MKKTKGKFIVLEGIDGSGKATQAKLLADYLKEKKIPFFKIAFPQYEKSFFGKTIRRYLKGEFGGVAEVSAYLAAALYAGDRFEARSLILKNLKKGKLVIADRYVSSNIGHQAAKLPLSERKKFIKWLNQLEYDIYQLPHEDLTIFLDINSKQAARLRKQRQKIKKIKADIHEQSADYLKKVAQVYKFIAKTSPNWFKIKCFDSRGNLKSPEDIHKEIINYLKIAKIL